MEQRSYLMRFEYEYYESKNPQIYVLTRKNENGSWIKNKKPMDPDPKNKDWYLIYIKSEDVKFQYNFWIKTAQGYVDDPISYRNADLLKIAEENIHDGVRSINDSWGTFYVNFEVQWDVGSPDWLQIATCTREVGDWGPPQYGRYSTMRLIDESEIENKSEGGLRRFYEGKVSGYTLTQKIDQNLKKVYFKLRLNKIGLRSKGYEVTVYDPSTDKSRDVGILKHEDIEESLFANFTIRGVIDDNLVYTPYEEDEDSQPKSSEKRRDAYERKFKEKLQGYDYDPNPYNEPKEETKYQPQSYKPSGRRGDFHLDDDQENERNSYLDKRYHPEKNLDQREEEQKEDVVDNNPPAQSNLMQLSENLFFAPFPKTQEELASYQTSHVKGVLWLSKQGAQSNFVDGEYLPNENVQQLVIMNKESKILSKISISEIPDSSHDKYNFRLKMAASEISHLIFKDKLKVWILNDESNREIGDGLVSFILSNPIED